MINKVEVRTASGKLLTLSLTDYSEGYTLEDVDGLDPVDAVLTDSPFAQQDGTQPQSAKRGNRNLILKLGFEPDYAVTNVRDLRRRLYGYLMPKSNVRVRLYEDDGLVVEIAGRVEKLISPRFTKDPDATINITCNLPDFVDLTPVIFNGNTTAGTTETSLNYVGNSESGFIFTLNANRAISGFTIYNTPEDNVPRSLTVATPMVNGDVFKLSTVPGNKYAVVNHLGVDGSVMYGVASSSNWLNLYPGVNKLRVLAAGAVIPWNIAFNTKYGGL